MKKTITLLLFILFLSLNAHSQRNYARNSLEIGTGINLYSDKLGNAQPGLSINAGYRYLFAPDWGVQGRWSFDVTKKDATDPLCDYGAVSHSFSAEVWHRIARVGRFTLNGSAGFGGTFFYLENDSRERSFHYTAAGSIFYALGKRSNPWAALKLEYRGTGHASQDYTLNREFRTTSNPIQSFRQNISAGLVVYLDNRENKVHGDWRKKPRIVHSETRYEVQKLPIVNYLADCNDCVSKNKPLEALFYFARGKHNVIEAHRPKLQEIATYMINNPNSRLEGKSWACIAGSIQEQYQWSLDRATEIKETLIALGVEKERIEIEPMGADKKMIGKIHDFAQRTEVKIIE